MQYLRILVTFDAQDIRFSRISLLKAVPILPAGSRFCSSPCSFWARPPDHVRKGVFSASRVLSRCLVLESAYQCFKSPRSLSLLPYPQPSLPWIPRPGTLIMQPSMFQVTAAICLFLFGTFSCATSSGLEFPVPHSPDLQRRQSLCGVRGYFPGVTRNPVEGVPLFAIPAASNCLLECKAEAPGYQTISLSRDKDTGSLVCNCWPRSVTDSTFVVDNTDFQEIFYDYTCDSVAVDAQVAAGLVLPGTMTALVGCHLRGHYPSEGHGSQIFPPFLGAAGCRSVCDGPTQTFAQSNLNGKACCSC